MCLNSKSQSGNDTTKRMSLKGAGSSNCFSYNSQVLKYQAARFCQETTDIPRFRTKLLLIDQSYLSRDRLHNESRGQGSYDLQVRH